MSSIVIADDHPLFRDALAAAVRRVLPGKVIVECSSLGDAKQKVDGQAQLLLLDLHMADSDGFAGLIAFRHDHPAVPIIVVSASEGVDVIKRAMAFGAAGYVPKSSRLDTICTAITKVMDGDIWTPDISAEQETEQPLMSRLASLTPAQLRVLVGVRDGRLNKQIAYDMGITEATVKAHLTSIFRKLGVINRTQAVRAAESLEVEKPAVA